METRRRGNKRPLVLICLLTLALSATGSLHAEPMLEWLPGEGLVTSQSATDSRPLITITPTGQPPAAQLPFDIGNLNEFRLELTDGGVSLGVQDYVTQSLLGTGGIGTGLMLSSNPDLGWHAGATQNFNFTTPLSGTTTPGNTGFQSLAQIQCRDGVVSAQGYLGQDCRLNRSHSRIQAGLHWQPGDRVRTRAGVFDETSTPPLGGSLNPFSPMPGISSRDMNLDLELGLTTDGFGDWTLGVQVARILDGEASQFLGDSAARFNPSVREFQNSFNTASLGVDWRLGDFGGGINSYYRAPIELRGSQDLDELTSFDIYFSWQTPWDGSLRIGASNLTDENLAPATLAPNAENDEQIYGRIPYVRYRQDL